LADLARARHEHHLPPEIPLHLPREVPSEGRHATSSLQDYLPTGKNTHGSFCLLSKIPHFSGMPRGRVARSLHSGREPREAGSERLPLPSDPCGSLRHGRARRGGPPSRLLHPHRRNLRDVDAQRAISTAPRKRSLPFSRTTSTSPLSGNFPWM